MEFTIHPFGSLGEYKYADIISIYKGKWIFSKHKMRTTWETQGGHIEEGETPLETAKRELYEEAGAVDYDLEPLCNYALNGYFNGKDVSGNSRVYFAVVHSLAGIPDHSEMEKICLFDALPQELTYPSFIGSVFQLAVEKQRLKP